LQAGTKAQAELQITYITLGTSPNQAKFEGLWKDANGQTQQITGTLTLNGQSVQITATRKSDSKAVFSGTLQAPNGYWRSGVELRGTNLTSGSTMFGVEDAGTLVQTTSSGGGGWGTWPTPPPHKGMINYA